MHEPIHCITENPPYVKMLGSARLNKRFVIHPNHVRASAELSIPAQPQRPFETAIEVANA
jgi:hypothetical protein